MHHYYYYSVKGGSNFKIWAMASCFIFMFYYHPKKTPLSVQQHN